MEQLLNHENLSRFTHALSWMLLHSLWQGLLLALLGYGLLYAFAKAAANVKYRLLLLLLACFVVASCSTFLVVWHQQEGGQSTGWTPLGYEKGTVKVLIHSSADYLLANRQILLFFWLAIVLFRVGQLMTGLHYFGQTKRRKAYRAPLAWQQNLAVLAAKLELKQKVALLESALVKMPVVVGWLKPVVLLPIGLLNQLPAHHVEAILLHELAHIRRNDYLVNVVQVLIEAIYFFNPGLLWLSAMLREEREAGCDEIAVAHTASKKSYIEALVSFKEYELYHPMALAFAGTESQLLQRIRRILGQQTLLPGKTLLKYGLLLLGFAFLLVGMEKLGKAKQLNPPTNAHRQSALEIVKASPATEPIRQRPLLKKAARVETSHQNNRQQVEDELAGTDKSKASLPAFTEYNMAYPTYDDDSYKLAEAQYKTATLNYKIAEAHYKSSFVDTLQRNN